MKFRGIYFSYLIVFCVGLLSLLLIDSLKVKTPFAEDWFIIDWYISNLENGFSFTNLFSYFQGSRIAVVKLFYLVALKYTSDKISILFYFSWFISFVTAVLVILLNKNFLIWCGKFKYLLIFLLSICIFSPLFTHVWQWGFNFYYVFPAFSLVGVIYLINLQKNIYFTFILSALVSSLSYFSIIGGLIIFPLILFYIFIASPFKNRKSSGIYIVLWSLLSIFMTFIHVDGLKNINFTDVTNDIIFKDFLKQLGSIFGVWLKSYEDWQAIMLGGIFLIIGVIIIAFKFKEIIQNKVPKSDALWIVLMLNSLFFAFYFRHIYGEINATTGRYVVVTFWFTISVIFLIFSFFKSDNGRVKDQNKECRFKMIYKNRLKKYDLVNFGYLDIILFLFINFFIIMGIFSWNLGKIRMKYFQSHRLEIDATFLFNNFLPNRSNINDSLHDHDLKVLDNILNRAKKYNVDLSLKQFESNSLNNLRIITKKNRNMKFLSFFKLDNGNYSVDGYALLPGFKRPYDIILITNRDVGQKISESKVIDYVFEYTKDNYFKSKKQEISRNPMYFSKFKKSIYLDEKTSGIIEAFAVDVKQKKAYLLDGSFLKN